MIPKWVIGTSSSGGARGRLSILIFHRVLPDADPLFPDEMDAGRFDDLLSHVVRQYNVVPLGTAVEMLAKGTLPSRALAVTFDDGYRDNLTIAAPILQRRNVPATVFVATAFLDGGCMWNDIIAEACRVTSDTELDLGAVGLGIRATATLAERRSLFGELIGHLKYLDATEREEVARRIADVAQVNPRRDLMLTSGNLIELEGFGIEIGAHTRHHPILARTSEADAWAEIEGSRRELVSLLRHPVTMFAYPNGKPVRDYTSEHVRMARDAGFIAAVSTAPGAATQATDPFQLPRFTPWRTAPLLFDLMMMRNLAGQ